MSSFFSNYRAGWKNAEAARVFETLPDGRYEFYIESAKGVTTQRGDAIIEWVLVTHNEVGKARPTRKTSYLNENGMRYLKADVKALGVDPDEIEFAYMDAWLDYFAGARVEGVVQTNGKYQNIYFSKLLAESGKARPDQNGFAEADSDDKLPWDN